jgi:hypothetical protein
MVPTRWLEGIFRVSSGWLGDRFLKSEIPEEGADIFRRGSRNIQRKG